MHSTSGTEEFDAAKEYYRRLRIEDRIEMDLRDGGHETHVESGLRFLTKWLKESPVTLPRAGRK